MDEKSPDLGHSADRDSHFLAAPPVSFLEEHVGYTAAARFHYQPLDLAYLAVGRAHGQLAAYVYLAGWNGVDGDFLRSLRSARVAAGPGPGSARAEDSRAHWKNVHARGEPGIVGPGGVQVRHDLRLLGGPERLELGQGAAKPDLTCCSIHKVNRNKPPWAISALRVDYEMSDLPGDRVDEYAAHMTAGSIAATGVGADPQRHLLHPSHLPH